MTATAADPFIRAEQDAACPKRMRHGPCGGVTATGSCEVPGVACPFPRRDEPPVWRRELERDRTIVTGLPPVIIDFRPDPTLDWELRDAARHLGRVDAGVIIGEHVDDPTPHRPSVVARSVRDAGLDVISTITCRGRSQADIDAELIALTAAEPLAVHCVTGDHPAARLRLPDWPEFALDSFELAAEAHDRGLRVSVAESPAAPPTAWRARRLAAKADAGAGMAILNHAGAPAALVAFADEVRSLGVDVPLVAPVPVITDRRSAAALERFPGLELPPGLVDRVLGADDPARAGVVAAVELGRELIASGRFASLNLSGAASDGSLVERAGIMASVAKELTP